jgi:4-hydroxybenzoate polyprenyltransferase
MRLKDYVFIMRPDHWPKNILVLPGCFFAAYIMRKSPDVQTLLHVGLALVSCCLLASANYTINEWLDSAHDSFHPTKQFRPGASGRLNPRAVVLQYLLLACLGLGGGAYLSLPFFITSCVFLVMGLAYNVPPARTKDKAYLDVATESFNNPVRFLLGWLAYSPLFFPPASILLAYWAGGGFLMAVKRYAEYRFIDAPEQAALYRASFGRYTEQSLLLYSIFCAITASFFMGIFLIKYHVEFVFLFPFIAFMFVWYLRIGMRPLSAAQSPEKLFREKSFFAYVIFLCFLTVMLALLDLPALNHLDEPLLLRLPDLSFPVEPGRP